MTARKQAHGNRVLNGFILRWQRLTPDAMRPTRRRAPGERVHDFKYISISQARTTRPDLTLVFTELQTKSAYRATRPWNEIGYLYCFFILKSAVELAGAAPTVALNCGCVAPPAEPLRSIPRSSLVLLLAHAL